jgi:hypothetical protein
MNIEEQTRITETFQQLTAVIRGQPLPFVLLMFDNNQCHLCGTFSPREQRTLLQDAIKILDAQIANESNQLNPGTVQ